jgi:hypothetical protein
MTGRMLVRNLPVQDLPRARRFYEALGFRINEHSSDDGTASVVVDESIVVSLLSAQRFAQLVPDGVADRSAGSGIIPCLTAQDRSEVDDLVARALEAGGRPWLPTREDGASWTGSFADPDGNVWRIRWLDHLHVVN